MIVGILGGIGSGKTTVLEMFRELGAEVVDADAIAHEVLETESAKDSLVSWFGERALRSDGSVDRSFVAQAAFADPKALRRLEELVHPEVVRIVESRIAEHRTREAAPETPAPGSRRALLVLDVPLLLETRLEGACDRLVFVDAPLEIRRQRVCARGWLPGELEARERFQRDVAEKRQRAHFVIDNSGDLEATRAQVKRCHEELLAGRLP